MKSISLCTVLLAVIQATLAKNIVVTAPNLLRLGVNETIGISISNYDPPVEVIIQLKDYPGKSTTFASQNTIVQQGRSRIIEVFFDPKFLPSTLRDDQNLFVYLIVTTQNNVFPLKEVVIPVMKYGGYAFVQTDKPLYQPTQPVNIRILYLNEQLLPVDNAFTLEITNPKQMRVLLKEMLPDPNGITETNFQLPPIPVYGNWSVAVNYGYKFTGKSKVQFEVKEYVLPTFSVKINPPKIILDDANHIAGSVEALYVYRKSVEGFTYLVFKVRNKQGVDTTIGVLRDIKLYNGRSVFSLRVSDLKAQVKWFPDIEGSVFVVEATVVEAATGKSSSVADDSTIFTKSPYTISLDSSLKEFKPGVPYQIAVQVFYINKQLLKERIPVEIAQSRARKGANQYRNLPYKEPILVNDIGRVVFSLDTEFTDEQLELTVKTKDDAFAANKQASASIIVTRYISPVANTYVWVAAPHEGTVFKIGSLFETKVHVSSRDSKTINYMVVSKGKIVLINETYTQDALIRSLEFVVTTAMVPTFRLIVYIIKDNKIIADSLRIEVEQICQYNDGKELSVDASSSAGSFVPGQDVRFKIKGEPMSRVGLAAVDEAVYILNKQDLLSRNKMFHEMQKHDLGNGPGGGINPANVFRNAGIQVLTDAHIDEHKRQAAVNQRKKRSLTDKVHEYSGTDRICCRLGLLNGPPGKNCTMRAIEIEKDNPNYYNCSRAFLDCCQTLHGDTESQPVLFRGPGQNNNLNDDIQVLIRTVEQDVLNNIRRIFPETWFFKTYTIGGDRNCGGIDSSVCEVKYSAPHSITTWMVQAVGVSKTKGMCVAKPLRIQVFKPMFIQLELPVVAIRGEQIEVMATVFNYGDVSLNVTVYMFGVEGICMGAGPGDRSEYQTVTVPGNNANSVMFPVMPLQLGEFPLKVAGLSWSSSDAIEKQLKVVPEGVPVEKTLSITLDPAGFYNKNKKQEQIDKDVAVIFDMQAKKQMIEVTISLPHNHIPDTEKCVVSLIGNNIGQAVNTTISGLKGFIYIPTGCGEQVWIHMAPLVYTMAYLKYSNQMTADIEIIGYDYLWKGYAHALNYRNDDGSFIVHKTPNYKPSTWLTAFASKILCQAKSLINIAPAHMCMAISWMGKQQHHTGAFFDAYTVHHREMTGGVQGESTLTAFVLISMMECNTCGSPEKNLAVQRGTKFLEEHLPFLKRPYAIALVAYALGLVKSDKANEANKKLKEICIFDDVRYERYWNWDASEFNNGAKPWVYQHHPTAVAVETTSYALLTMLLHDEVDYSHAIVNWLNKQRTTKGSFISTQDTVIALQALAQYNIKAKFSTLNMVVKVTSTAVSAYRKTYNLKPESALVLLEDEAPPKGKLLIDVTGQGLATLGVNLHYNVEQSPEESCKFELTITSQEFNDIIKPSVVKAEFENQLNFLKNVTLEAILSQDELRDKIGYQIANEVNYDNGDPPQAQPRGEKKHVVKLNICIRNLENKIVGMSILDIGLFTGYSALIEDLNLLLENNARTKISQFEIKQQSIILYVDEVPFNRELCISFRTARSVTVGRVQPAPVKVYSYYEPAKSCTKFYKPAKTSPMLKKICEGNQCFCLQGLCPSCHPFRHLGEYTRDIDRRTELLNMACDRHDYVWNGTIVDTYVNESFRYFKYHISAVMKAGTQKNDELEDEIVTLIARDSCTCPKMDVGKVYIIMGQDGRPYTTEDGDIKFKYLIDKTTSTYNSRPIRDYKNSDTKGKNIQKAINSLYNRLVENNAGCSH